VFGSPLVQQLLAPHLHPHSASSLRRAGRAFTRDITVNAKVANFNIVDKQGQANVVGEGHLHFYLDVEAPTTPGNQLPHKWRLAHVAASTYTFTNVASGTHTISVQLVNNDHTPVILPWLLRLRLPPPRLLR